MHSRTILTTSAAIGLMLIAAILAGCSGTAAPASPAAGGEGPASSAAAPTIEILEPAEGGTVAAGSVTAKVEITNLKFTMPSNTNVPGEGHVHFTLDDRPFVMSVEPEAAFKDVGPGEHRLEAEVVQNNTQPLDPPVKQEITFTVR